MIAFLLILIFLFAACSFVSFVYCWLDIRAGKPYILSLRQITGIMDRNIINSLYGMPQKGFVYPLSPQDIRHILNTRRMYFYRECLADSLCIFGAWRFMTQDASAVIIVLFLLLGGLCQGLNMLYSYQVLQRWGDQIREELEPPEE